MASFASRLREFRKLKNLRQKDLAGVLALAQTTIANYEQGSRFPDEQTLQRVADYFHTSLDYLLGRSDINLYFDDLKELDLENILRNGKPYSLSPLAKKYLDEMLDGNGDVAGRMIVKAVEKDISVKTIYLDVFEPVLKEVGRLWSLKEVDATQEHFISASTQRIMSQIMPFSKKARKKDLTAISMSVCGEHHEIGARFVSDFLEMNGWNTYYVGANLCHTELHGVLNRYRPDLLAMSVTMNFNTDSARNLIEVVRSGNSAVDLKVMVGGQAIQRVKNLWMDLGAHATAGNSEEAVRVANDLVKHSS